MTKHTIDIIDEIAQTSSRKEKEQILADAKNDPLLTSELKSALTWCYEPTVNFYLTDLSDLPEPVITEGASVVHYSHVLDQLSQRTVTGNEAKQLVSNFMAQTDTSTAELLRRIIKRSLEAGITATTINKVYPELIYVHPYMRCSTLNKKSFAGVEFPCFGQNKADGMYTDIMVYDDRVEYTARSGEKFNFNDPERDAELIKHSAGFVIQGEALVKEGEGVLDRSAGNGYLNSDDVDMDLVKFEIWDAIPMEDFEKGLCTQPYKDRFAKIAKAEYNIEWLSVVNTTVCNNMEDIIEHFQAVRSVGGEGIIVKNYKLIWKSGTSKDQLKLKVVAEGDMVVTGSNPGKGKHKGLVGSIVCQSSDGTVEVGVSGFSDKLRKQITEGIDYMIADEIIITVKYNDITSNENTDKLALYLPRLLKIREDKKGADNADDKDRLYEILNSFEFSL
ncbi:MAG: hypothetical protein PF440_03000 [Thiomicrorhabdus sp.]|jgi:DNA ligase-1|nr:hypothetical protein [Thiomicrorhabdus sp.]